MRLCDRCHAPATDTIIFEITDQRIDICDSCSYEVLEFLGTPKETLLDNLKELTEKGKNAINKLVGGNSG